MFSQAFEAGLRSADLSYGDNLWGSRRLNAALAGFYNQYVSWSLILHLSISAGDLSGARAQ